MNSSFFYRNILFFSVDFFGLSGCDVEVGKVVVLSCCGFIWRRVGWGGGGFICFYIVYLLMGFLI